MLSLFDKLKIKHRLLLLMVIPLCGFIAMSFKGTMEKRVAAEEAARLGELTRVSVKIGALAHEMQKERGMTSGFIGSKGAKFASELPAQRLETDKRAKEFMDTLAGFDASHYAATLKALVAEAREGLNPLGDKRKAASALTIPAGEAIGYYTQTIGKLLKIPAQVPSLSTNSDISRLSSGYANLLYAKERAGIERATLANVFGVGKFSTDMLQRFIANASAQEVYTNQFLTFATESQTAFYKSKVSGASVEEVARLKKWAQDNATEPLNVDATLWFKVATERINLLKEVEDRLSADLISTADEIRQDGERIVLAYTFLALASLLVTFILAYMIIRSIAHQLGGEPLYAMQVAQRVAEGNLSVAVDTSPGDTASLVASMKTMQEQLLARITADKKISDENARIRIALGNVSANVMIADNDNNIIYLNPAVQRMLKNAEADLRRHLPDFDASRLEGANMDAFHKNPAHQRDLLATLTTTYRSQIEIAGRTFYLIANPVVNDIGERIGSVVEWADRTNEVHIEKEVNQIVQSAQQGVLTERLNLAGKEGFMKQLSGGINQLLDTVSGALNNLERVLAALALGDLTQNIDEDYQGTFGQLKNSANATVENLTQLVGDIKIAVGSINTGAREIAMGNADLSQRTEEQAASLEETASSMEELTSTVKANSDNAHQANQYAIGASDVAGKGGAVVSQVVGTMSSINDSSRKIVDIISVIDGIAFQTNILALNAAVEAARAGEQGRGFAVVAAEVRNLAQRSAAAAKEIKILIGDSVDKVENGSRLVEQAGQTMEDIVTSIKRVTGIMAEISSASVEQSSGIEQVNKAITQMDEVTQQNAALVEQAAAAAESLEEQAQNLFASVAVFKLESGSGLSRG